MCIPHECLHTFRGHKEAPATLEMALQMVRHHVGAGNGTWVLCKSCKCSLLLSHWSSSSLLLTVGVASCRPDFPSIMTCNLTLWSNFSKLILSAMETKPRHPHLPLGPGRRLDWLCPSSRKIQASVLADAPPPTPHSWSQEGIWFLFVGMVSGSAYSAKPAEPSREWGS